MENKAPPGVFDILPYGNKELWRSSHLWNHVETLIRQITAEYGFQEIRTPLLERTELFQRTVGETSDIVSKEMYSFEDRGGRKISLRPEGTAPTIRAFLEHHLAHQTALHKFFYIAPMFRYERAQAGRYRQHHQFGVEAIGNNAPEQDAEVIDLLCTFYTRLGIKNFSLVINSLGDQKCRFNYRTALKDYLQKHYENLSSDSKNRFETNPLRILDSKEPEDRAILANAPSILDFLEPESEAHFKKLLQLLSQLEIPYSVNPHLVRGLDYYNRTVFEVTVGELGAQNSIGGGGRYDGLFTQLGKEETPALGFGTGIERLLQTLIHQKAPLPSPYRPTLFLIPLGEKAKEVCFIIVHALRQMHLLAQMDFSGRKLNKVMQHAHQIAAKFTAVVGDDELEKSTVNLKNMETGEILPAPLFNLGRILRLEAQGEDFIRIWNEINTPFKEPLEAKFFLDKLKDSIESTKKLTAELQGAMQKMEEII